MTENNRSEDRFVGRKGVNSALSLLSAFLVLCGVAVITVGDAPLIPFNSTEVSISSLSEVWLPACLPLSGKIPMISFLPDFENTTDGSFNVLQPQIPDNALPVISLTIQPPATMSGEDGVYINNEAGKDIDILNLLNSETEPLTADGSVRVIIYHTHGSESYNTHGLSYYGDGSYDVHSDDVKKNVVHIGGLIAEKLREVGIGVVHDTTMYDLYGYSDAYDRSCEGVERLLEKYPDAEILLDIHRDTVVLSDGTKYRPVTEYEGEKSAQMMILVGTGKPSAPNDHWLKNLSLAVKIHREAELICPDVMRPLLLRNSGYNQHLSNGALLVEMGTCGNSLSEAEAAAEILSEAIIKVCIQ